VCVFFLNNMNYIFILWWWWDELWKRWRIKL